MTPVHEFLGITKEAELSPSVKAALTMGGISAGTTALAAVGTSQLQAGIQSAHDAVSRSIAFKKMMRDNPDIQKMDGKQARRYFNTLFNTAPELAKDPFAAGSWVKKVEDYDYVDPQSLSTLASTGAKMRERKMNQMIPAFQLAQGSVQAGMGEYGRMEGQRLQEDRLLMQEAEHKYQKKKDIIRGIADVAGVGLRHMEKKRDAHSDSVQRYEDQMFRLGQEERKARRDEWDARYSPKAMGVKTPDQAVQYMADMERRNRLSNRIGPKTRGEEFEVAYGPRPFPGTDENPYKKVEGYGMPETVDKRLRPQRPMSTFERMHSAIRGRFGGK